ncbi:type III secretion system effector XopF2 [Acidovorax sp. NCPPB 4044]|uniref:type III secretion system effector XopF2 n=1 Tax=Acidovorax sp. NCPPB 4044 TaxID=2940490 RepID=UPI002303F182|nr:type III secretion system effector XopF2 [Acidovorax sp. NCPPB 4044]MDA8523698.1 hypothetical protein [Acidovorax sp. NCPPB 4044]
MIGSPSRALLQGVSERSDSSVGSVDERQTKRARTARTPSSRSLPAPPQELQELGPGPRSASARMDATASQRRTGLPPSGLGLGSGRVSGHPPFPVPLPVPESGREIASDPGAFSSRNTFYSTVREMEELSDFGDSMRMDVSGGTHERRPSIDELSRSHSASSMDLDTVEPRGVGREEEAQRRDAPGAVTIEALRAQVEAYLATLDPAGPEPVPPGEQESTPLVAAELARPDQQAQMQTEYVAWAAEQLMARHKAYGSQGGFRMREDMEAVGVGRASVAIAYESLKGFMTSATRTPSGGSISTLRDNEDGPTAPKLWPAVFGGLTAGPVNYLVESILIPAMDRRSRVANLPVFKAVDPKVLQPEPAPVQLEVVDGTKRFWRPIRDSEVGHIATTGSVDRKTRNALRGEAYDRRKLAETRQKLMDGKAEAALLKPVLTAGANAFRRWASSAATLASPLKVLGWGAVASGGASAVNKAVLDTTKALQSTGQVVVPDLVGGTQRLNLFRLALPDESQPPLQWKDARRLPGFGWEVAQEAVPLLAEAFRSASGFLHASRDFVVRSVGGNVVIGAVASAAGLQFASAVRGSYGVPEDGESHRSVGSVLQQAGQSFFSELGWSGWKALMGDISGELASRLDDRRNRKQERLWSEARGEMRALDTDLEQAMSVSMRHFAPLATPAAAHADAGADDALRDMEEGRAGTAAPSDPAAPAGLRTLVEQARHRLAALMEASPRGIIDHGEVAAAADTLRRLTRHSAPELAREGADLPQLQQILGRLDTVERILQQREGMIEWREGRSLYAV